MNTDVSEPLLFRSSTNTIGKRCAVQTRPKTGAMVLFLIITAVCYVWISACVQEAVPTPISSSAQ
jgi:hypothetical protein